MQIILGGYLETALVRYVDAIDRPHRNETGHAYYMCLNRKVAKPFFDRAATFLALAETTIVPSIDWGVGGGDSSKLDEQVLGVSINSDEEYGGREWDPDTRAFVRLFIDGNAFSLETWAHISTYERERYELGEDEDPAEVEVKLRRDIAGHYLCRLLLQVRAAADSSAFLALSEPDLVTLREIGDFMRRHKLPSPYEIPDVSLRILNADSFASGLINFCPPDALAMAAAKADPTVKAYGSRVAAHLAQADSDEGQRELLQAMRDTYHRAEANRKVDKAFEIASMCVKPLHYIPGLDAALSIAEDAADLYKKWVEREVGEKEWYLIAAKMTEVSIHDYLARKDNQI